MLNAQPHLLDRVEFGSCSEQVARMKAAQVRNPISCAINDVTAKDVDEIKRLCRFLSVPAYEGLEIAMKEELHLYKARIAQIRPIKERLDEDGQGTFDIQSWLRESKAALPAWSKALRAVLCHAPNSAPPGRAFGILNNAIGDQQVRAREDYKKATVQLQFHSRGREY